MIIPITGAFLTGKALPAQRMLELLDPIEI